MPCLELFNEKLEEYDSIFGNNILLISLEASTNKDFYHITECNYGLTNFGASGPAKDLKKKFKFTKENLIEQIKEDLDLDLDLI